MTRVVRRYRGAGFWRLAFATIGLIGIVGAVPAASSFAEPIEPAKWSLAFQIGWNTNKSMVISGAPQEERNVCSVISQDECEAGQESSGPRGFVYPEGVAVSQQTGDVYIADKVNHRIQVLDAAGRFVSMFGWKVNKTTGGNTCTETEIELASAVCGEGEAGEGRAGQLFGGEDVAVDPNSGNVYVLEVRNHRVEEFTAGGDFVLMIGGDVNKKGGTVCTKAEEAECQGGAEGAGHGEFEHLEDAGYGNIITVASNGLLYVGDQARIQKFDAGGAWVGQLSLADLSATGLTHGVAVDASGDVFVVDSGTPGVHVYNQNDELQSCIIDGGSERIHGVALDAAQRLGVVEGVPNRRGLLFGTQGAACGVQVGGDISRQSEPMGKEPTGLAFSLNKNSEDELYVAIASGTDMEVEAYAPILFPPGSTCAAEDVEAVGAVLCGHANPSGLETTGFFKYGTEEDNLRWRTPPALTSSGTSDQVFHFHVVGLVPNQLYYDEAFAEALIEGKAQEGALAPIGHFHTSTPPPESVGAPEATFVAGQSAVLNADVNPEHAFTSYHFEYAACPSEADEFAKCGEAHQTPDLGSSEYGPVSVAQEIGGLQPLTTYAFRLVADNRFEYDGNAEGGLTTGAEGRFTSTALADPQVTTGGESNVTPTSAVISGNVDPDGEAATYAFELGLYKGPDTQFGMVSSGSAGAAKGFVTEYDSLSGLQPGTTYSFRISITSGYVKATGGRAFGEAREFTTPRVPNLIEDFWPLPPVPSPFKFARSEPRYRVTCKRGFRQNRGHRCIRVKRRNGKRRTSRSRGR